MTDLVILVLLLSSSVATLLFVWFNTNAFVEYMQLLRLSRFFRIHEYVEVVSSDPSLAYHEYIASNYVGFFPRLFNCSKCLAIQFSVLVNLFVFTAFDLWKYYPAFPICILSVSYFGLCLYYLLSKLMRS
jgi:hypothetical protein